ncbi:hypothetical protein DL95DRAFT_463588 [Leptodontidium sp. 2 PMI_412]|nr:hypothetical protein DL95DRAFT_463588 [Leptodontidium sp. 2 PMI_412]
MADNARIGYPPTRVWDVPPQPYKWTYRISPEKAKRMLLTDDLINGKEAELESASIYSPIA